jgi:hypothetical protein
VAETAFGAANARVDLPKLVIASPRAHEEGLFALHARRSIRGVATERRVVIRTHDDGSVGCR